MPSTLTVKLYFFAITCLVETHAVDEAKRLLVNDPDLIEKQFTQLEQTISALRTEVVQLKSQVQRQDQIIQVSTGHGSTYIRWGKSQCKDSQTELIYSGYAAGQYFYHPADSTKYGGPANTLCLPHDPQLTNETFTDTDSLVRGTEYERNTFASNSQNEDMPCVMCRSVNSTSSVMIPGRQSCYTGWRLEYQGFIASGHEAHSASEYICVDGNPEYIPSGKAGNDGHLMYMAGIKCGPLPCPPYEDNRKLPCVVCSK